MTHDKSLALNGLTSTPGALARRGREYAATRIAAEGREAVARDLWAILARIDPRAHSYAAVRAAYVYAVTGAGYRADADRRAA